MNTPSHRDTAKILAFKRRADDRPRTVPAATGSVVDLPFERFAVVDTGGWYHEAAIREAGKETSH